MIRVPQLKSQTRNQPVPTPQEKLRKLVVHFAPKAKIAKPKKLSKKAGSEFRFDFRRRVTKRDALKIFKCRHPLPGIVVPFRDVAERCGMHHMTVHQVYKRFIDNGNQFVDGRLRNGKYSRGKLVGKVKDFLLD